MKELCIIESETPGITKTKLKYGNKKPYYAKGSNSEKVLWSFYKKIKKERTHKGKKIIKIYRSSWNDDEFFIKHFM